MIGTVPTLASDTTRVYPELAPFVLEIQNQRAMRFEPRASEAFERHVNVASGTSSGTSRASVCCISQKRRRRSGGQR